jgi:RecA-family ATPase
VGLDWFTGRRNGQDPGNVVWCDTEGNMPSNIKRRREWGLPKDRIRMLSMDLFGRLDMDNEADMGRLMDTISYYEARLVVVDSLRGAHRGDENNSRIATGLQNLADVAARTGAAVHLIHHTGKPGKDQELSANSARGSNAFWAMVRTLLGIDTPDPDTDRQNPWRRLQMLGSNLGPKQAPVGWRFAPDGLELGPAPVRRQQDKAAAASTATPSVQAQAVE